MYAVSPGCTHVPRVVGGAHTRAQYQTIWRIILLQSGFNTTYGSSVLVVDKPGQQPLFIVPRLQQSGYHVF